MGEHTHFVIYEDDAGEFRWRLIAANGRIVADSGESYTRERDAHRSAADLATWATVALTTQV